MILKAEYLTSISLVLYVIAALLYAGMWLKSIGVLRWLSPGFLLAGLAVNVYQLMERWSHTDQPPFRSLYETLVLLAACVALVYLVIELVYRTRILGLPSAIACVMTMAYAVVREDKDVVNLPPALQSGWFVPHVVIYFFGYGALFVATGAAFIYLIRQKPFSLKRPDLIPGETMDMQTLFDGSVRFGFALLTVGLLIACAWAHDAWGNYWGWDPKETWALITWFFFGIYLHLYHITGWRGKRLAWMVLVGFAAVAFTYLGMHLLPSADQSIHVYQ